jgi:hypothetical protein
MHSADFGAPFPAGGEMRALPAVTPEGAPILSAGVALSVAQ